MSTEKAAAVKAEKAPEIEISLGKRITHFLVSMKLALTLLFVIALLSIIGTILPQGDLVYETDWVNNPLFDFYKNLGLFNMYYSWWFLSILGLLIANLSVCITKRLPTTFRHFSRPRIDVKDAFVINQPISASIPGKGEQGFEEAVKVFSNRRYRIRTGSSGTVMAEKGRFTPLASICFHASFIFLLIGALLGWRFGFEEILEVPDGKTAPVPNTNLQVKNNGFQVQFNELKDENGRVTGYKPATFSSDLQVFENGELVGDQTIEVNAPLRIRAFFYDVLDLEGVNFHQNSYYRTSRGYVTVLGVNQRPGKNIIYLGGIMMMAGISFAIYFPHRRVWIKSGENGDLLVGGRTNRSKVSFQKDFDRMITKLRLSLKQEEKG